MEAKKKAIEKAKGGAENKGVEIERGLKPSSSKSKALTKKRGTNEIVLRKGTDLWTGVHNTRKVFDD